MKPVVSSLVALALAIAPLAAFASPDSHDAKPVAAKVVKHKKAGKTAKADTKIEAKADKADKAEKTDSEKPSLVAVKHTAGKKHGKLQQVHHAHGVDVSGPGHKEPSAKESGAIVPASMTTKNTHLKAVVAKEPIKKSELPSLPGPNAGKPSKGGAEKGGKKAAPKKSDDAKNDGEPARDEDFAELVARIRGRSPSTAEKNEEAEDTKADDKHGKAKQGAKSKSCLKEPVEIIRGPEVERFALATCDGKIAPLAVEQLSVLTRPGGAARPVASATELAKKKGAEIAPGIKRVEERLVANLAHVIEHFTSKDGTAPKVSIVSGYRPTSVGSMHQSGRAIDFRLEGIKNEDVVAFCKTLDDSGCGFYPNSSFVHMDVRDKGAGHVTWIDASGPGETPRYVASWPPPAPPKGASARRPHDALEPTSARHTEEAAPEAVDEHPATPASEGDDDADKTTKNEE